MMAFNRPPHNDPFFPGGRFNDLAQPQGVRQSSGHALPNALPLHQAPGISQPPQQSMNAASLAAAAAAAASPGSLESRMMMRRLMIRRAAQQAQDMQSLHSALLAEANAQSIQQQLQQQQQHSSLLQHRQATAFMDQYQQSPVQGLELLRSVSLAQQQQRQQQHRVQLGLPSIGQLDHSSFLSPSPNQPASRFTSGDFSMLPRAPFSRDQSGGADFDPISPSNNTVYSPSSSSTTPKNTVKLFVDEIREWDVLCGRGGRSNHHSGNKRYRHVVSEMKASYRTTEAKARKTDLSRAIVEHVCQYGGRFLKKDSATNRYYVLTKAEARKKTSQALRETKELKWTALNSQQS